MTSSTNQFLKVQSNDLEGGVNIIPFDCLFCLGASLEEEEDDELLVVVAVVTVGCMLPVLS